MKHELPFLNGRDRSPCKIATTTLCTGIAGLLLSSGSLAQSPGSLDTNFIKGQGADGFIRVVSVQPDGKILAGGNFTTLRGSSSPLIGRLNQDGTFDSTFHSTFPLPVLASRIYSVQRQADARLIVAGLFTDAGSSFRTNIARLNSDGSLDESFDALGGPSGLVRIVVLDSNGRILIGGEFTAVDGTPRNRIARLNSGGLLDGSFNPGAGASDVVRTVAVLPTGQILIGGLFTSFDGNSKPYLARLNSDGTLDQSFPAGTGPNNNVYFVSPQADGTILISGDFTSVNGTGINRIARLKQDGSLDSSFSPTGGVLGGAVYHVLTQANGRIILGGAFTAVNGTALNRLARLNTDGSLDMTFNPGAGASDMILSLAIQNDGMLLAGGLFSTYAGTEVGMIARVYGDASAPVLSIQDAGNHQIVVSWPSWASSFTLQAVDALSGAGWQTVTNIPVVQSDKLGVTLPVGTTGTGFFRLAR